MTFSAALNILKDGGKITRESWGSKNLGGILEIKEGVLQVTYEDGHVATVSSIYTRDVLSDDWAEVK